MIMKNCINIAAVTLLVFTSLGLFAQGTPPPPDAVSGAVDSGALILLVVVASYGYMKLKNKNTATT